MPTKDYQTDLLKRLANPEYAAQYLKIALDETLIDGNKSAFLLALKNVIDATENIEKVATKSNMSSESLLKIFSEESNLTLDTLTSILNTIGITLDFKPRSQLPS